MSQIRHFVAPALVALAASIVVGCSEPTQSSTASSAKPQFSANDVVELAEAELCKHGTAANFEYTIDGGATQSISLADGECAVLGANNGVPGIHNITVTELSDPSYVLNHITPTTNSVPSGTPVVGSDITGTPTFSGRYSGDVGLLLDYYNDPVTPPSNGCTLTQGYWKNHTSVWPSPYSPSATFYTSGQTWLGVLNTPAHGNAYYILGYQFIAATLNVASGASAPANVQQALSDADAYFTDPGSSSLTRDQLIAMAGLLDSYNNGLTGPGHCSD